MCFAIFVKSKWLESINWEYLLCIHTLTGHLRCKHGFVLWIIIIHWKENYTQHDFISISFFTEAGLIFSLMTSATIIIILQICLEKELHSVNYNKKHSKVNQTFLPRGPFSFLFSNFRLYKAKQSDFNHALIMQLNAHI